MTKRGIKLSLIVFLIIFIFSFQSIKADDVGTSLTINYNNVPPALINTIPDQTWAKNTNLTNAFDLDDYFFDNETLTYSSTSPQNISIIINETTNKVSFYPDYGFEGTRDVVFTAFDASTDTDSNTVTLNVTEDTQPPTWSNPSKDISDSQIFQNTVVKFTTDWEDNVALSSYLFSIKQESGWVNQSPSSFSGTQNTSSYSIQISAPAGTTVEWIFHGFDTTGNMNFTETQSFTVATSPSTSDDSDTTEEEEDDDDSSSSGSITSPTLSPGAVADFTIDPDEEGIKVDIVQGSSGAIIIKITNTGNTDLFFEIEIGGLEEFEKLISESSFNLTGGDSKTVTIDFTADRRLTPDLYYGNIKVKSSTGTKDIPVVIAVKAIDVEFDLSVEVPEEYKEVSPGEVVKANITLTNLKQVDQRNITFYYAITNFEGDVIDSAFEEFTFAERSITLDKELSIPDQIERGEYIFFARAVSGKDIVIDSDTFEIGERFNVAAFVRSNIFFFAIVFASVVVALMMMKYQRNRQRLRLLNLYLMVTELNKLVKSGKHEEAVDIYVRIKSAYGEPVSQTALSNKEELKKEMEKLAKKLDVKILQKPQENSESEIKNPENNNNENKQQSDDKKSEEKPKEESETKPENKEEKPKEAPEEKIQEPKPKEKEQVVKSQESEAKSVPEKPIQKPVATKKPNVKKTKPVAKKPTDKKQVKKPVPKKQK